MKLSPRRRGAALLGILGAVAGGMLAVSPNAGAADFPPTFGTQPGHLFIHPTSGNMTTNPLGTWTTDAPCADGFQANAQVAIITITPGSNPPEFNVGTAGGLTSVTGSTPPGGSFSFSMAELVTGQGLQAGSIYEVAVRCLSADFDEKVVQSGFIQIAADGNSWSQVSPSTGNPVHTTTTLTADPTTAAEHADIALTATVHADSGTATGTVEFFDGTASLGTAPVGAGGTAAKTVNTLSVAEHPITAKFTPTDPNAFGESTSSAVTVTVTSGSGGPQGSETITVDIPSTGTGAFTLTVSNQNVTMTQATVTGANLTSTGSLNAVTVNDTRPGAPGWSIQGRVDDFKSGGNAIPGDDLGWTPSITTANPANDVTAGQKVNPGGPTGLKEGAILVSAGSGKGAGRTTLGADLLLQAPAVTPPGTYSTTLTLTAMTGQ